MHLRCRRQPGSSLVRPRASSSASPCPCSPLLAPCAPQPALQLCPSCGAGPQLPPLVLPAPLRPWRSSTGQPGIPLMPAEWGRPPASGCFSTWARSRAQPLGWASLHQRRGRVGDGEGETVGPLRRRAMHQRRRTQTPPDQGNLVAFRLPSGAETEARTVAGPCAEAAPAFLGARGVWRPSALGPALGASGCWFRGLAALCRSPGPGGAHGGPGHRGSRSAWGLCCRRGASPAPCTRRWWSPGRRRPPRGGPPQQPRPLATTSLSFRLPPSPRPPAQAASPGARQLKPGPWHRLLVDLTPPTEQTWAVLLPVPWFRRMFRLSLPVPWFRLSPGVTSRPGAPPPEHPNGHPAPRTPRAAAGPSSGAAPPGARPDVPWQPWEGGMLYAEAEGLTGGLAWAQGVLKLTYPELSAPSVAAMEADVLSLWAASTFISHLCARLHPAPEGASAQDFPAESSQQEAPGVPRHRAPAVPAASCASAGRRAGGASAWRPWASWSAACPWTQGFWRGCPRGPCALSSAGAPAERGGGPLSASELSYHTRHRRARQLLCGSGPCRPVAAHWGALLQFLLPSPLLLSPSAGSAYSTSHASFPWIFSHEMCAPLSFLGVS